MKEKFSHSPMVDMAGEVLTLLSDLMRVSVGVLFLIICAPVLYLHCS